MNNAILSGNLKKLRLDRNLTQEQAAQLLGVSAQSVSRWECGTTLPDVMLLPKLARIYAVTTDDLFREDCCAYQNYAQRLLAVYEDSGRLEDFYAAQKEFQKLFAAGHCSPDDLYSCGVLYQYLMGHARDRAEEYFDRVLAREEKDPVYYRTWQQKISLMAQTGRSAQAVAIHQALLDKNREDPRQWLLLVAACCFAEDYESAGRWVRESLQKFPEDPALHYYAGQICKNQKSYDEAFAHWQEALRLDGDFLDARYAMGDCFEELGEYAKACTVWEDLAAELTRRGFDAERLYPLRRAQHCREQLSYNPYTGLGKL